MSFVILDKLDIRDGVIHYGIYAQNGRLIRMTCADTPSNRMLVAWMQRFDRHEKSWINKPLIPRVASWIWSRFQKWRAP